MPKKDPPTEPDVEKSSRKILPQNQKRLNIPNKGHPTEPEKAKTVPNKGNLPQNQRR